MLQKLRVGKLVRKFQTLRNRVFLQRFFRNPRCVVTMSQMNPVHTLLVQSSSPRCNCLRKGDLCSPPRFLIIKVQDKKRYKILTRKVRSQKKNILLSQIDIRPAKNCIKLLTRSFETKFSGSPHFERFWQYLIFPSCPIQISY